jgi:cell division transport system permease protein
MTEPYQHSDTMPAAAMPSMSMPRVQTPIVPRGSIAGRALVAVVAIMTFLASLTAGAVVLVVTAASEWRSEVAREVTIQVRPVSGRDIEVELRKAVELVRAAPGIADVRPYTTEESARLLEPWLGGGLLLDALPVPRLIVVRIAPDVRPDLIALRQALSEQVAGASLDDHRGWIGRMRTMAGTVIAGGLGVLALVLVATALSVTFAARAAMAANRPVIEVLHFIGARDGFIAAQFQRHFMGLGLRGGALGGGGAIVLFALAQFLSERYLATAGGEQASALFGSFAIGPLGYAVVIAQITLIAALTAETSRRTVNHTLASIG